MPVEIKELIIKVNVNQDQAAQAGSNKTTSAGTSSDKETLVMETVEEVLRIIENKKER